LGKLGCGLTAAGACAIIHKRRFGYEREKDVFRMTQELGLRPRGLRKRVRLTQSKLARKFVAPRSRGEPSVPAQLALDGLDRQLRRK